MFLMVLPKHPPSPLRLILNLVWVPFFLIFTDLASWHVFFVRRPVSATVLVIQNSPKKKSEIGDDMGWYINDISDYEHGNLHTCLKEKKETQPVQGCSRCNMVTKDCMNETNRQIELQRTIMCAPMVPMIRMGAKHCQQALKNVWMVPPTDGTNLLLDDFQLFCFFFFFLMWIVGEW